MEKGHINTIETLIQTIFLVTSRRSSLQFAKELIADATTSLKTNYPLFQFVTIKKFTDVSSPIVINISEEILTVSYSDVCKGLESLIRIIYDEIYEKSGLYFMTEIKNHLDKQSIHYISVDFNVDFEQLQNEQHFIYRRKQRKKEQEESAKPVNILGYTWSSVSDWSYNDNTKQVELLDEQGKLLDKIDLKQALQNYVFNLSGIQETSPLELEHLLEEHQQSYSFLKLIYQENVDFDTAKKMLNLTDDEINKIINDLIKIKFLHFVSDDEIELTESGKEFIS